MGFFGEILGAKDQLFDQIPRAKNEHGSLVRYHGRGRRVSDKFFVGSNGARRQSILLPSIEKKERHSLAKRLFTTLEPVFILRVLFIVMLASTSAVGVLCLIEHLVKFPNQATHLQTTKPSNDPERSVLAFDKPCGDTAEQCLDQDLIDNFLALHEWGYYQDKSQSKHVILEAAMTGEYALLYVNYEHHVHHCTLLWRKTHRALISPLGLAAVDGYMASYAHSLHCEHMLLDWSDRPFELIIYGLVRQFQAATCLRDDYGQSTSGSLADEVAVGEGV